MKRKLTTTGIDTAKPGEIWDALVPGFGLRTTANKAKGFFVMYRLAGRQVRWTFANAKLLGLPEARERARQYLQKARDGIDPQDKGPVVITVRAAFDRYIKQHVEPNQREGAVEEAAKGWAKNVMPYIGDRPITAVTKAECVAIWDRITERKSLVSANRTYASLSGFFNFCLQKDLIQSSPMAGTKRPHKEKARNRPLTAEEVMVFWKETADGSPAHRVLRLLMLTGKREAEGREMLWEEVNDRTWTIPAVRGSKTDEDQQIYLSDAAFAVLGERGTGRVFPGLGYDPVCKARNKLRAKIGGEPFTTHDLRHTIVTRLSEDHGFSPDKADALLNHKRKGMVGVYNHATFVNERRTMLELWGRVLEGKEEANVVHLHAVS